jgi:hypothetical protein
MTRDDYLTWGVHAVTKRGVDLPQSKLTDALVRSIRASMGRKLSRQWAEELGMHVRTIEKVRTGQTWGHV